LAINTTVLLEEENRRQGKNKEREVEKKKVFIATSGVLLEGLDR
jgi:hypothetical protein